MLINQFFRLVLLLTLCCQLFPIVWSKRRSSSSPTGFPTSFFLNETEFNSTSNLTDVTSQARKEGENDRITMAAIFLITIPALLGVSLSFALVKKSMIVSQPLPTSSSSKAGPDEDEVIEWESKPTAVAVPQQEEQSGKAKDEATATITTFSLKTTKTFQEWFVSSPRKQEHYLPYTVQKIEEAPKVTDSSTDGAKLEDASQLQNTVSIFQKMMSIFNRNSTGQALPPKKQFVINIFKEEDPFMDLTVATPLDEQEDEKDSPFFQYLQGQSYRRASIDETSLNSYVLRI